MLNGFLLLHFRHMLTYRISGAALTQMPRRQPNENTSNRMLKKKTVNLQLLGPSSGLTPKKSSAPLPPYVTPALLRLNSALVTLAGSEAWPASRSTHHPMAHNRSDSKRDAAQLSGLKCLARAGALNWPIDDGGKREMHDAQSTQNGGR
ncbi:hypothetical protein ACLKA7_016133 [Drosophila subpalustris]